MKKVLLFAAAFLNLSALATRSEACSYYIDETASKNQLVAAVANDRGATLDTLNIVAIEGFCWYESKSTPMCPEELTFAAQVVYRVKGEMGAIDHRVNVVEVANWVSGSTTYSFASAMPSELPTCGVVPF